MRFVILVSLVLMISCSPFEQIKSTFNEDIVSLDCQKSIALVKANWQKHRSLNFYKFDETFLNDLLINHRNCLFELDKENFIKLFGEPNSNANDVLIYFLKESCLTPLQQGCKVLQCQFNENTGKLGYLDFRDFESISN